MKIPDMKTSNDKDIKKKIKLYPKIVLGLMILILVVEFAIPLINNHYIKPKKFKKTIFEDFRNDPDYEYLTDYEIKSYADCLYSKFIERYEKIDNFPMKGYYNKSDVKILYTCASEFIFKEEKQKFFIEHMDSLVNAYFIPSTP
jgi:hypothetical protein